MPSKESVAVIEAYSGRIVEKRLLYEPLETVVKNEAVRLIRSKWMPEFSDFMIFRDTFDVELRLPLRKEEFEMYKKYRLRKVSSEKAVASIPLYLIVYESLKISEEEYHDRGVAAVTIACNNDVVRQIEELLIETTKKPSEQMISVEAEEAADEEAKSKKRGRKKKS